MIKSKKIFYTDKQLKDSLKQKMDEMKRDYTIKMDQYIKMTLQELRKEIRYNTAQ